jgi:hypothetical protein
MDGRKTMTRRPIKPQPKIVTAIYPDASIETELLFRNGDQRIHCPYGRSGDLLWVRETFAYCPTDFKDTKGIIYKADAKYNDYVGGHEWLAPRFMPRWASRITLLVTDVRVQRIQEISESDMMDEGVRGKFNGEKYFPIRFVFKELWDSIYLKKGMGWDTNLWVRAITFEKTNQGGAG